jgi:hypothetical protein
MSLNTVSPAYSAICSTTDSGIPTVGAAGEKKGRRLQSRYRRLRAARQPSLPECAQASRCGDGHGQLGAGQTTAHAGLGDRNFETEPVKQVHRAHRNRVAGVGHARH